MHHAMMVAAADCRGDDEACVKGQPRFVFWGESQRALDQIVSRGGIDVGNITLNCRKVDGLKSM
jgi:hypothetical protein